MAFSVEAALSHLERAHRQGRLAHAYLVTGTDGKAVEALVVAVIRMLNGDECASLDALRSGHVHLVRPESKSRRILIAQVRALGKSLYMAAPAGKTKVAVIQEADRLGPEAESAFLKTLEEPPAGSLILLLTSHPQQLHETILSRCLRIPLRGEGPRGPGAPEEERLVELVAAHLREERVSATAALGLAGRFSEILAEVKGEIAGRIEATLKEETKIYDKRTEGDWLAEREEYYKALVETEYLERRDRLVAVLLTLLGDALRQQNGFDGLDVESCREATAAIAGRWEPRELSRRFSALERMHAMLGTNANEKLVLEASFLEAFL